MSKSEWKEHPDWRNLDDYAFLDNASVELWAWEFLRRNPAYRRCWRHYNSRNKSTLIYRPKKLRGENNKPWVRRCSYENGVQPTKLPLGVHLGKKWGLEDMFDPYLPYSQGVCFLTSKDKYPRFIRTPKEFMDLVEDEELGPAGLIQRVQNRYAVVVYDLMSPITEQTACAQQKLFEWYEKMVRAGRIENYESHAGKPMRWWRHLRALDACRTVPRPTNLEISIVLEGNKSSQNNTRKQGDKIIERAREAMRNHLKILKFSSTPSKNKRS